MCKCVSTYTCEHTYTCGADTNKRACSVRGFLPSIFTNRRVTASLGDMLRTMFTIPRGSTEDSDELQGCEGQSAGSSACGPGQEHRGERRFVAQEEVR